MRRIVFTSAVVFLALSAVTALAQEPEPAVSQTIPAASRSQSLCTGFVSEVQLPNDLYVMEGADDDARSRVRLYIEGDSIFIGQRGAGNIAVGAEYSVIRPGNELFKTSHYQGQGGELRRMGRPYEDVALVRVTHVNEEGAVAKVTFSCEPISVGDTLIPFQPRAIPEYAVNKPLDHFIPEDKSKQHGRVAGTQNNFGSFGQDTVVYVDIGERQGILPGKRLRIYKSLPPVGISNKKWTPSETVGEAVVLTVQAGSCTAMVVSSYREIYAGDLVEVE